MRRIGTLILLAVLMMTALPTFERAAAQGTCGTAQAPRLTVGQSARVVVSDGTGNNLRATANMGATVLGVLADGEVFSVLSGPQCAENFWWWQVRRWDGQTGWTAEGEPGKYWVEPWPVLDAQLSAGTRPNLPNVLISYLSGYEGYLIPTVMQVSGQDLRTIGTAPSPDHRLMWSPDGSRLIFSDGRDLWLATTNRIAAADGSQVWNPAPFELRNLTNGTGGNNTWASFAPDGLRIVFVSDRDGNEEIYTASVDGSSPRNLTNSPNMDREPAWSFDGARIAFVSDRDGNAEIYTMSAADGSAPTRVTNNATADSEPVWSRDGKLAFAATSTSGAVDLWVVDPTGPRALTTNEKVRNPVWSPDGTRIAYVAESPVGSGREEIFSIRADGTDKIQYTVNGGKVSGLTWSPGGLWLVYADDSSGNYDLYSIRASGIGVSRLTNNPGMDVFPVFQPPTTPGLPNEGTSATAPGETPAVPGTTPGAEDLLLIYTANPAVFTLKNTSGQAVDLTPLSFTGAGMTVPATIWTEYTASPLNAFKDVGCLMVFPFELGTQPAPAECGDARQGWVANSAYTFWTQGTFTVNHNGAPIATCQTAAGRCSVDLP